MKVVINRICKMERWTVGEMFIDGSPCGIFTLEDAVREIPGMPVAAWKRYGETAIPAGRYSCVMSESRRFGMVLPEVLDVPGFEGVRFHSGNTDADTEGCILVGKGWKKGGFLSDSRAALSDFLKRIGNRSRFELEIS